VADAVERHDVERELRLWRARAETAELIVEHWRSVQNRRLWKVFEALDRLRERLAPPRTRRERVVLSAVRQTARMLRPLGRATRDRTMFRPKGHKDVLFIRDVDAAWTAYRNDHHVEQLAYLGLSADLVHSAKVDLPATVDHYDTFVLNRVERSDRVGTFLAAARSAGKPVIFGTDDLIFEPELEPHFAFLEAADESQRTVWRQQLDSYRRTIEACDGALVSTMPLGEHARRHVDRVEVVYNAVGAEMLRLADEALEQRVDAAGTVTIGYLSGTPSHNRDFLEAADAVVWALETHPNVRLLVVGFLDLDSRFDRFAGRVTRLPRQPFDALPAVTAQIDINLAPLERANPFTQCKSCVKYLEAGLVAVPTIASQEPDFARVIADGRNGLLAGEPAEWRDALRRLIESPELRAEMGERAAADVRQHHTTKARASELGSALSDLTARRD
jgi:glycosyltransferase involved in cell wall biosynthesis